jgi:M6 family metalloprotease-like protein
MAPPEWLPSLVARSDDCAPLICARTVSRMSTQQRETMMFVRSFTAFVFGLVASLMTGSALAVDGLNQPFAITSTTATSTAAPLVLDAADVRALTAALDQVRRALPDTDANRRAVNQVRADLSRVSALSGTPAAALSRSVLDQLDALSAVVSTLGAATEQFGIRTEQTLGTPECPKNDAQEARCAPLKWLETTGTQFHTIRKTVYLRGSFENHVTKRMSASFVADAPGTHVAIVFSAEAFMRANGALGGNPRMKVRALLDGQPTAPGDVVFATTSGASARAFIFTAQVDAGIHTVEMQWKVDPNSVGLMRDASLLVRTGQAAASTLGALVVKTPASGASVSTTDGVWTNVPDMNAWIHVPLNATLTASLSAESYASNGKLIGLRAVIDNSVLLPTDVVFARGAALQSRMASFATNRVMSGWHKVTFQWLTQAGGSAVFGDRSLALAAYPSAATKPSHPVVIAPSGANLESAPDGSLSLIPGMQTTVFVGPKGNGEVAVQFSAEIGTQGGALGGVVLAVDNLAKQHVTLSDGMDGGQVRSWVFAAKHLSAGAHTVQLYWYGGAGAGKAAFMGDRIMSVISETGFIPDLAEAPRFGGGHIGVDNDNIGGVEALIGTRKVLAILMDPHFCDADGSMAPDCYDQTSVPKGKVESALYGLPLGGGDLAMFEPDNVRSYLNSNSNGRFTISNAAVLGWYNADHPAEYYTNHPDSCVDGFKDGSQAIFREAIAHANSSFDFAAYDTDSNGTLDSSELAIVIILPRPDGSGSQLVPLVNGDCNEGGRISADGVRLPQYAAKVNMSLDSAVSPHQFSNIAHELMHLLGGLDDLYFNTDTAVYPRGNTLMADSQNRSSHLDPMHKLALGWVTPKLITRSGELTVTDVKQSDTVYIMPRYNNPHGEEYFIVENRQANLGGGHFDAAIDDSGIAVWQVVSDRSQNINAPVGVTANTWATLHFPPTPVGSQGQMGRNGLRLIRPFQTMSPDGTAFFLDLAAKNNVFWDKAELSLQSAACATSGPTTLTWSDCAASGYSVDFLNYPSNAMSIGVTVD